MAKNSLTPTVTELDRWETEAAQALSHEGDVSAFTSRTLARAVLSLVAEVKARRAGEIEARAAAFRLASISDEEPQRLDSLVANVYHAGFTAGLG